MNVCRDPDELSRLIDLNAPPGFLDGETAENWLADPRRFALIDGEDLSLFEAQGDWPCALVGHILFKSRGAKALATAREMLSRAFAFGATEILGEVPIEYRHCQLLVRKLEFQPYAERENELGRFVLVRLSRPPTSAEEYGIA